MFLHFYNNYALISNENSSIEIPMNRILSSIKATLKLGLPVIVKYSVCDFEIEKLTSKHIVHNDKFTFINVSLKNKLVSTQEITSLTEIVDYMLDLNGRLS